MSKINETMVKIRRLQDSAEVGNGVLGRLLNEESLPDEAVADFIINLIFAGNETTAKTMLFAVYFLTQCPRALKELQVNSKNAKSTICFFKNDTMIFLNQWKKRPFMKG